MAGRPPDYDAWHHCITVDCGIPLTPAFVSGRLQALKDRSDPSTQRFAELYGEAHLQMVISWFERANREFA